MTAAEIELLAARLDRLEAINAVNSALRPTFQLGGCLEDRSTCPTLRQGQKLRAITELGHPVWISPQPDGRLVAMKFCSGAFLRLGADGSICLTTPGAGS